MTREEYKRRRAQLRAERDREDKRLFELALYRLLGLILLLVSLLILVHS